jgi:hypothetical protein
MARKSKSAKGGVPSGSDSKEPEVVMPPVGDDEVGTTEKVKEEMREEDDKMDDKMTQTMKNTTHHASDNNPAQATIVDKSLEPELPAQQVSLEGTHQPRSIAPARVVSSWYVPEVREGFESVLGFGVLPRSGQVYPTVGVIAQYVPQETYMGETLELMRLALSVYQKFAAVYRVKRMVWDDRFKRTADEAMGFDISKLRPKLDRNDQLSDLYSIEETMRDADIDTGDKSTVSYRDSVAVVLPEEAALYRYFSQWCEDTFFVSPDVMIAYMVSKSTPAVRVIPPVLNPYGKALMRSHRPWGLSLYHEIIFRNPSLWPDVCAQVLTTVKASTPKASIGTATFDALKARLSPNLAQAGQNDALLNGGSRLQINATSAQAFLDSWCIMLLSNYRARCSVAIPGRTTTSSELLCYLAFFVWGCIRIFDEHSVNVIRNMVANSLVRLTVWNDAEAISGVTDFSHKDTNGSIPPILHNLLHPEDKRSPMLFPIDQAVYEGGQTEIMAHYPIGYQVLREDENDGEMHGQIMDLITWISTTKNCALDTVSKRALAMGLSAMADTLWTVQAVAFRLQYYLTSFVNRTGCIAVPEPEFASADYDSVTYEVPVAGPLSLLFSGLPPVDQYRTDFRFSGLADSQALGATCAAWTDSFHLVKELDSAAWKTEDRVKLQRKIYDVIGPKNWFADLLLDAQIKLPLRRMISAPSETGPWFEAIHYAQNFVQENPTLFGYARRCYGHAPARDDVNSGNTGILWRPTVREPGLIVSQRCAADLLRSDPDQFREAIHGNVIFDTYVPVRSELFSRKDGVPEQYVEGKVSIAVSERPLIVQPITYYITPSEDEAVAVPWKLAAQRYPTITVDDPRQIQLDVSIVDEISRNLTHIRTRRDNYHILEPSDCTFVRLTER